MATIFPVFEAIYVISLASRPDRRMQIQRELARFGIRIGEGAVQYFDGIRPADAGGFGSIGIRGCFLSHLEVLRRARNHGLRRFLVLEDDAMFTPAFGHADSLMGFCLTDEWDFLYPGHIFPPEPGPLRWISTSGGVQCTHAYALRGEILPPLIEFLEGIVGRRPGEHGPGPMHIDAAYSVFMHARPGVRIYRASKSLVLQRSSKSDVAPDKLVDRVIPATMLGMARRLKSWIRKRV